MSFKGLRHEPHILGLSDEQKEWFDVTTEYFILHTKTSYNNATFAMSTVFKVGESNNIQVVLILVAARPYNLHPKEP